MDLEKMTKAQLEEYCQEHDVSTKSCKTKRDLIDSIKLAEGDPVIEAVICNTPVKFRRSKLEDARMLGAISELDSEDYTKMAHGMSWMFRIIFGNSWSDKLDEVADNNDGLDEQTMVDFVMGLLEEAGLKN